MDGEDAEKSLDHRYAERAKHVAAGLGRTRIADQVGILRRALRIGQAEEQLFNAAKRQLSRGMEPVVELGRECDCARRKRALLRAALRMGDSRNRSPSRRRGSVVAPGRSQSARIASVINQAHGEDSKCC